ncbi:type IV toxin-antitoxin system AbiEi family antitoxin domain-containing protein [Parafannyhessea umbonata]|uniref:type IV toxin-antitoxin system AbiEi family antitoxin domain-containing protein n=1 Tax=Parafannyhessea umbonata TaxID=604330 RepID=UPI00359C253D
MNRILERAVRESGGLITAAMVTRLGVQRRELTRAVEKGELLRLGRGLYCTPETWEDEYVIAQYRFARGIFSHDTALYLLGLSDQSPETLAMSFPRGYNPSSAKRSGIWTRSSPSGLHQLGVVALTTPYGNAVACYNAERTLCDMLRGTSTPDLQLLNPAMRSYLSSPGRSVTRLQSYARALGVSRKIGFYLEVLL